MDTSPVSRRQRFSPALKAEVLEACADPGASILDIAQKYDTPQEREIECGDVSCQKWTLVFQPAARCLLNF